MITEKKATPLHEKIIQGVLWGGLIAGATIAIGSAIGIIGGAIAIHGAATAAGVGTSAFMTGASTSAAATAAAIPMATIGATVANSALTVGMVGGGLRGLTYEKPTATIQTEGASLQGKLQGMNMQRDR
jgi:hypothetical protein